MSPVPAAATATVLDLAPLDLSRRLRGLLCRSPEEADPRLAERLLSAASTDIPEPRELRHSGFYWLLIPELLATSFGLTKHKAGIDLLDDLLWVQYCVYGLFRVQDDLVDGDSADAILVVQANHLLIEAARRAAEHFSSRSSFWEIFWGTIETTSRTIQRLDRLQRTTDRDPEEEIALYADLSACLKIASAAVCVKAGREEDWRHRISPALDSLAAAAQVVDDVRDLRDDIRAGKINYAAWHLARPVFGDSVEATEAVIASSLATSDRLPKLLVDAAAALESRSSRLRGRTFAGVRSYLDDYRRGLTDLAVRIDKSRRDVLLEAS